MVLIKVLEEKNDDGTWRFNIKKLLHTFNKYQDISLCYAIKEQVYDSSRLKRGGIPSSELRRWEG